MNNESAVLDTERRITDINPLHAIEQLENIGKYQKRAVGAANEFASRYHTGAKNITDWWRAASNFAPIGVREAIRINTSLADLVHNQVDRVQTTVRQVTAPITPVKPPVEMYPVFEDDHVQLKQCALRGQKPNDGGDPLLVTVPIMRKPGLLLAQSQTNPEENRSVVKVALQDGFDVYITDWKNPDSKTKFHGMREYLDTTHAMTESLAKRKGEPPMGAHICNFGYMAALALGENPDSMYPNIYAGTPFDIQGNYLAEVAQKTSLKQFESLLRANGWVMRGDDMVRFWKYGKGLEDVVDQMKAPLDIYHATADPNFDPEKYNLFNRWLEHGTVDIAGGLNMDIFRMFKYNQLMEPGSILGINLSNYKRPLGIITGGTDDISPVHQCLAALDLAGTPKELTKHWNIENKGHSGIYISPPAVNNWRTDALPWMREMR